MNKLFIKLDNYLDYNNHYSLSRALTTIGREFEIAVSQNNIHHARAAIDAARKMYEKLSSTYRESEDYGETMSYSQKLIAQKMRRFIAMMIQRTKTEFGTNEPKIEPETL